MLVSSSSTSEISPRSYSKLPAIKRREKEDILAMQQNDSQNLSYRDDFTRYKEDTKPLKIENHFETNRDPNIGQSGNENDIFNLKSSIKSLKPIIPSNSSGIKSNLDKIQDTNGFMGNKGDENFVASHKTDSINKINERYSGYHSQIDYKSSEQDKLPSANSQTDFKTEVRYQKENLKYKNFCEVLSSVPGQVNVNSKSEFGTSKSLSPVRTLKCETSPRSTNLPINLSESYQEKFNKRNDKTVKLPNFQLKSDLKLSDETRDMSTIIYFNDATMIQKQTDKATNQKTNATIMKNKQFETPIFYKSDCSSNKISPRVDTLKNLNPVPTSHGRLETKMFNNNLNYQPTKSLKNPDYSKDDYPKSLQKLEKINVDKFP